MSALNAFRIMGDLSHVLSKLILLTIIHYERSARGISLLTQALYALVFCARYLDIFWTSLYSWVLMYTFSLKIFYILSSFLTIYVMRRLASDTHEMEEAWNLALSSLGLCAAAALVTCGIGSLVGPMVGNLVPFEGFATFRFGEIMWVFSIMLESICILPQLILLRLTEDNTVINSYYLVALGSYRAFYLLNWIFRAFSEGYFDPISTVFGIIQTLLYLDFLFVYMHRQQIRLGSNTVIDCGDLANSFIVGKVINAVYGDALRVSQGSWSRRTRRAEEGRPSVRADPVEDLDEIVDPNTYDIDEDAPRLKPGKVDGSDRAASPV